MTTVRIRWTDEARNDLQALQRYISVDSPSSARRFCARLVDAVEGLSLYPRRGRLMEDADADFAEIRQLQFRDYRILDRVDGGTVFVLTIVHGARDLERLVWKP